MERLGCDCKRRSLQGWHYHFEDGKGCNQRAGRSKPVVDSAIPEQILSPRTVMTTTATKRFPIHFSNDIASTRDRMVV